MSKRSTRQVKGTRGDPGVPAPAALPAAEFAEELPADDLAALLGTDAVEGPAHGIQADDRPDDRADDRGQDWEHEPAGELAPPPPPPPGDPGGPATFTSCPHCGSGNIRPPVEANRLLHDGQLMVWRVGFCFLCQRQIIVKTSEPATEPA